MRQIIFIHFLRLLYDPGVEVRAALGCGFGFGFGSGADFSFGGGDGDISFPQLTSLASSTVSLSRKP